MKSIWKLQQPLLLQFLLAALLYSVPSVSLIADTFSDRRAQVGLKLFRTLVGADTQIENKTDGHGHLLVYLVYGTDEKTAQEHASLLTETLKTVRDIPVEISPLPLSALNQTTPKPAAIFVSQPLSTDEASQLVAFSTEQHIIAFSPFEGDVERGILAGLSVEATVKPLINKQTLQNSQLAIKPFYLKVAKHHD